MAVARRTIWTTDEEWRDISARALAEGMTTSRYIVVAVTGPTFARVVDPEVAGVPGLPVRDSFTEFHPAPKTRSKA